ncbi:MAG: DsbA family protein [Deltaproteobacteria bacterium]|nr:DsbA family protein [Deltaproteobacteria bacterium]
MFNGKMVASIIATFLLLGHAFAQPVADQEILARIAKDGPAKGSEKAPITLIEFSDFQCSFCRKFWQTTLPQIQQKYIKTGKARFVYRHLAILGKPSLAAAQASECAHEQGKFWDYHDKLFASAGSPLAFTRGRLEGYARELALKGEVFNRCLESEKYLKKVEGETAMGAFLGARGTPTFFLNGRLIVGAQPFDVFASAIEKELKGASSSPKKKP